MDICGVKIPLWKYIAFKMWEWKHCWRYINIEYQGKIYNCRCCDYCCDLQIKNSNGKWKKFRGEIADNILKTLKEKHRRITNIKIN